MKHAQITSPINSFGIPNPFSYLYAKKVIDPKKNRAVGCINPTVYAEFLHPEATVREGFVLKKQFYYQDGRPSLGLTENSICSAKTCCVRE